MQFSHILLIAALAGLKAATASAATQSLDITVENTGDTPLACGAAFAHWFSADLGEIAPDASLSFSFGVDEKTGTVFQLNTVGDQMAVQRIWCGRKGQDWATRAEIPLERRAGVVPRPMQLRCMAEAKTTRCMMP